MRKRCISKLFNKDKIEKVCNTIPPQIPLAITMPSSKQIR